MIHVRFATGDKKVKTLGELSMDNFTRKALTAQLSQHQNNLEKAVKTINQYLCYPHVERVQGFIVWNKSKAIKSLSNQFQWIGDYDTGFYL